MKRNPAGIPIDWKQVEVVVEGIIDYIAKLREHIIKAAELRAIDSEKWGHYHVADQMLKWKDGLTVGEVNSMSMRQALLSVGYPAKTGRELADPGYNYERIYTGISIPIIIKTKSRNIVVETKVFLKPAKRQKARVGYRWTQERKLFTAGASAYSPIPEFRLKEYLEGKRKILDASICINVSSEIKYKEAIQQITLHPKTTRENLRDCVVHEITHIADPLLSYDNPQGSGVYADKKDWAKYYNVPTEWRARVNEYISRVRSRPQDFTSFDDFLDKVVKNKTSWQYLTNENKRNMLAALYSEWTKITEKPAALTEFQKRKKLSEEKQQIQPEGPPNLFKYFSITMGARYGLKPVVQQPKFEVYAAQVEDKPLASGEKRTRTVKPVEFVRKFRGRGSKVLRTAPEVSESIDSFVPSYRNKKYYIEIRTLQKPIGGGAFSEWDGDYDVLNGPAVGSPKVSKLLEKIYWPIGCQRVISVYSKHYKYEDDVSLVDEFSYVREE